MDGSLLQAIVSNISQVAGGIKVVSLDGTGEQPLPRFSPGAHITLHLQDGSLVRRNSYTLIDTAEEANQYRIAVQLQPYGRGGSKFVHEQLKVGHRVSISHPLNLFGLHRRARKHVFIAGGIGITPFLTLAQEATRQGTPFELHYTFRHAASAAFVTDLQARYPDRIRLYESTGGQRLDPAQVMSGQPVGTHLYACGPTRLIDALSSAVDAGLWPRSCFHFERFKANFSGLPFSVRIRSTGEIIDVEQDQSLLERLEDAGYRIPYMCRVGFCGRCRIKVITGSGKLIHNDQALDDDEKHRGCDIVSCVSRFESDDMTLDL
ncbi:PDR/VanB family oxidoreductase [Agrobacterium sp. T29]|uniref:PDR/VanB family oxidoreductase n=1 Tax=Agrobacterium sp. T29 TaxID=2580515 RepID=UPI00115EB4FC|nr:PDR/VanB family oxidoreductase [Agrobacterium sp. T29]